MPSRAGHDKGLLNGLLMPKWMKQRKSDGVCENEGLIKFCNNPVSFAHKLCMFIFSDVEGVLKSANGTEYGLASGVFTKDLSKVCCCMDIQ